jgi:urease accessory protein
MVYAVAWRYDPRTKRDADVHEFHGGSWCGELALDYERRAARTVLARRRHVGPLQVQKPFYPEGPQVCHGIVLHPPGGIAGGDDLRIDIRVGTHAAALLTTPGAGKWYRSRNATSAARQCVRLHVESDASLEWLPQPTIVFDGAAGSAETDVTVDAGGCYMGWEIVCLGRTASGERFRDGRMSLASRVHCAGAPVWLERGHIEGGSRVLDSPAVLAGRAVYGTFVAVTSAERLQAAWTGGLISACRSAVPFSGRGAITRLPQVLVARYLGERSDAAHDYFARLWQLIRPALLKRSAESPRIWRT